MPNAIPTPTPSPPNAHLPAFIATPGVFNPTAVGRRGYPATSEAYDRQLVRLRANSKTAREAGKLNRRGVPNGWAGKRGLVAEMRQDATDEAWKVLNVIQRNSFHPDERLDADCLAGLQANTREPETDAERFAIAATYAIGVVRDPTQPASLRLQAARMILPFLAPMPHGRAKAGMGLGDGLAWLDALTEEG